MFKTSFLRHVAIDLIIISTFILVGCSSPPPPKSFRINAQLAPPPAATFPTPEKAGKVVVLSEAVIHEMIRDRVRYITQNPNHGDMVVLTEVADRVLLEQGYAMSTREELKTIISEMPLEKFPRYKMPGRMKAISKEIAATASASTLLFVEDCPIDFSVSDTIKEPFHDKTAFLVPAKLTVDLAIISFPSESETESTLTLLAQHLGGTGVTITAEPKFFGYALVTTIDDPNFEELYWIPKKKKVLRKGPIPEVADEGRQPLSREAVESLLP